MIYYDLKGRLKEGVLILSLPANMLPEGIIAFTMMDSQRQAVAERLFFNERPESRINIALSTDEDTYSQRDLTKLDIQITNNDGHADLEALLLSQGWRKYLYSKPTGKFHFKPEAKLYVSGSVGGVKSMKKRKEIELTMMTFGHSRSVQSQTTDSLGRFNFSINDECGSQVHRFSLFP